VGFYGDFPVRHFKRYGTVDVEFLFSPPDYARATSTRASALEGRQPPILPDAIGASPIPI